MGAVSSGSTLISNGPAAEKRDLKTSAQSGQDLRCSHAQCRDLVQNIGLKSKNLDLMTAAQTGLGLHRTYMHMGFFVSRWPKM